MRYMEGPHSSQADPGHTRATAGTTWTITNAVEVANLNAGAAENVV